MADDEAGVPAGKQPRSKATRRGDALAREERQNQTDQQMAELRVVNSALQAQNAILLSSAQEAATAGQQAGEARLKVIELERTVADLLKEQNIHQTQIQNLQNENEKLQTECAKQLDTATKLDVQDALIDQLNKQLQSKKDAAQDAQDQLHAENEQLEQTINKLLAFQQVLQTAHDQYMGDASKNLPPDAATVHGQLLQAREDLQAMQQLGLDREAATEILVCELQEEARLNQQKLEDLKQEAATAVQEKCKAEEHFKAELLKAHDLQKQVWGLEKLRRGDREQVDNAQEALDVEKAGKEKYLRAFNSLKEKHKEMTTKYRDQSAEMEKKQQTIDKQSAVGLKMIQDQNDELKKRSEQLEELTQLNSHYQRALTFMERSSKALQVKFDTFRLAACWKAWKTCSKITKLERVNKVALLERVNKVALFHEVKQNQQTAANMLSHYFQAWSACIARERPSKQAMCDSRSENMQLQARLLAYQEYVSPQLLSALRITVQEHTNRAAECPICMTGDKPQAALVPCGHCVCTGCAERGLKECPSCRKIVTGTVQLYLE